MRFEETHPVGMPEFVPTNATPENQMGERFNRPHGTEFVRAIHSRR
jgi:hypothetical protein